MKCELRHSKRVVWDGKKQGAVAQFLFYTTSTKEMMIPHRFDLGLLFRQLLLAFDLGGK